MKKTYSADFKAKVVLVLLKWDKTVKIGKETKLWQAK